MTYRAPWNNWHSSAAVIHVPDDHPLFNDPFFNNRSEANDLEILVTGAIVNWTASRLDKALGVSPLAWVLCHIQLYLGNRCSLGYLLWLADQKTHSLSNCYSLSVRYCTDGLSVKAEETRYTGRLFQERKQMPWMSLGISPMSGLSFNCRLK
jgi:hypothetical protein